MPSRSLFPTTSRKPQVKHQESLASEGVCKVASSANKAYYFLFLGGLVAEECDQREEVTLNEIHQQIAALIRAGNTINSQDTKRWYKCGCFGISGEAKPRIFSHSR